MEYPFLLKPSMAADFQAVPLGSPEFRRQYFLLDDRWTFLNHGAFGACTRYTFDLAAEWRRYSEQQPLRFFDRELMPLWASNLYAVCSTIDASVQDTVLVQNATSGLNAIVQSIPIEKNDAVICFDTAYGMYS